MMYRKGLYRLLIVQSRDFWAHSEKKSITRMLQDKTPREDQEDRLEWMWSKNKLFTMVSSYTVTTYRGRTDEATNIIWKTHAPTKIRGFMWLLVKNATFTQDNLQRKSSVGLRRCSLCQSALENAHHIFH